MKTHPKYVMGPLIFGGLILSLFLSLLIYHIRSTNRLEKATKPHTAAGHTLKSYLPVYGVQLLKRLFTE